MRRICVIESRINWSYHRMITRCGLLLTISAMKTQLFLPRMALVLVTLNVFIVRQLINCDCGQKIQVCNDVAAPDSITAKPRSGEIRKSLENHLFFSNLIELIN